MLRAYGGRGGEWRGRMEVIMRDKMNERKEPCYLSEGSKAFCMTELCLT